MRVVVAGGAGFIGSHVCDSLIERGDEVIAVDNLLTGRRGNIAQLEPHERFTFFEHDITEPFDVGGEVDAVMDLASPASPDDFLRLPLEILAVGSTGTRNLLELARAKQARFFLASTSEIYGDPLVHPQIEAYWGNVDPIGPRSCYDEAKRFSEALTVAYKRVHGLDIRIARIFNTYGPRMRPDDGRVVTNFIAQALSGRPLTLYDSGNHTRSFCYVDDEVRGLIALLDAVKAGGPVNIGNPTEFTMRELAELVLELTGSSSPIVSVPMPPEREGDPAQRRPDITLAIALLDWRPVIGLSDGLARTIPWVREALTAETQ